MSAVFDLGGLGTLPTWAPPAREPVAVDRDHELEVKRAQQRRKRRRQGIGPMARCNPTLTLEALRVAGGFASINACALYLGMSGSTVVTACREGLTIWTADRCAVALGSHPSEVFGQAWWDACAERDREIDEQGELDLVTGP